MITFPTAATNGAEKRSHSEFASSDIICPYDMDHFYNQLCYEQQYSCVAWSPFNAIAFAPPPSVKLPSKRKRTKPVQYSRINIIVPTLHFTSTKPSLSFSSTYPIELSQKYHVRNAITFLRWSQRGNHLVSIDESGALVLWEMKEFVNDWRPAYNTKLHCRSVAFEWLNTDRMYTAINLKNGDTDNNVKTVYQRAPFRGPRNPFGYLAFLVVTIDGKLLLFYQNEGTSFTKKIIEIPLPCYPSAFSRRISHANITMNDEGRIYLSLHCANFLPQMVYLFEITVDFLMTEEGLKCTPCSRLSLTLPTDDTTPPSDISRIAVTDLLVLCGQNESVRVIIATAQKKGIKTEEKKEQMIYQSALAVWELSANSFLLHNNFQQLTSKRNDNIATSPKPNFVFVDSAIFPETLVTSLNRSEKGELLVGLSDGNVKIYVVESKLSELMTLQVEKKIGYFGEASSKKLELAGPEFATNIGTSPNSKLMAVVTSVSTLCFLTRTPLNTLEENDANEMIKGLTLSLLNNVDATDLVWQLLHFEENTPGIVEQILEAVYANYLNILGEKDMDSEMIQLSRVGCLYGLCVLVFRVLKRRTAQNVNVMAALHITAIYEAFMSSCTADLTDIQQLFTIQSDAVGEKTAHGKQLTFDEDSLWSLFALTTWLLSCAGQLFEDAHVFFHLRKRSFNDAPLEQQLTRSAHWDTDRATNLSLLCHGSTRKCLLRALILAKEFQAFVKETGGKTSGGIAEKKILMEHLRTHLGGVIEGHPVRIDGMIHFLEKIDTLLETPMKNEKQRHQAEATLLVRARIPSQLFPLLSPLKELLDASDAFDRSVLGFYDSAWLDLFPASSGLSTSGNPSSVHVKQPLDTIGKVLLLPGRPLRRCTKCHRLALILPHQRPPARKQHTVATPSVVAAAAANAARGIDPAAANFVVTSGMVEGETAGEGEGGEGEAEDEWSDPTGRTRWYLGFVRTCICGGLWQKE
ncbi:uncharacterized protein VTP21DRAFT_2825 [Calcarisporiella thermophila]|uniref:uncharacterized protein n=1 Tax=Calcarisporiella thermophila TaxID=911321 RepID=UPI003744A663